MANPSQWLEEGAGRWPEPGPGLYSEAQRLALEELVAGGPEALRAFLRREQLPPFLSEPEVQAIARGAVPPAAAEEEPPSLGASPAASSLTYFPERSDVEPPALELGWPGFAAGAFRGLTRVEAHFQPGCGDGGCGCKEAVRRQIRSARQVGARRLPGGARLWRGGAVSSFSLCCCARCLTQGFVRSCSRFTGALIWRRAWPGKAVLRSNL